MLLKKPLSEPSKYLVKVLDANSAHMLPHSKYVPLIYPQAIELTPEMYPERPASTSQLFLYYNPIELREWTGGVPIGRIIQEERTELTRLVIRQFRHKLYSLIYNPPYARRFLWKDYGSREAATTAAEEAQKEFCDKHNVWRNMYRINFCEFTESFYLEVKVNHFFPEAVFECDFEDIETIFSRAWYLRHYKFTDKWENSKVMFSVRTQDKMLMPRILFPTEKDLVYYDNNVLNSRRSNFVKPEKTYALT